ncbi:MAG: hypothetical protein OEZ38_00785, partial [Gammaproteobacteria bacterium]|nr:hypothetical protein [Gammaproteobacteria bacterium]
MIIKKCLKLILLITSSLFYSLSLASEDLLVTILWFDEIEAGNDQVQMRYMITPQYLRIDNGNLHDDFILFDVTKKIIFSVNHEDRTILLIRGDNWKKPDYKFVADISHDVLEGAPAISGKQVKEYKIKVNDEMCTHIQYIPDMYKKEMNILKYYQQTLSSQQIRSLSNTPDHMKTPCFMLDVAYNDGIYYDLGLPVQEWHNRGYARYLKDYKQEKVAVKLFE